MEITGEVKERFMAKVKVSPETGCWEWQANRIWNGYGRVWHEKRLWLAHRASYVIHVGAIPDGMSVLHKCDNRCCVNPSHLFTGTYKDNNEDMRRKGRGPNVKGTRNGRAKLTEQQVIDIRDQRYKKTQRALAAEYGIAKSLIQRIQDKQAWSHI